ncbi:MAG: glycosyltransferase family 39 protein, partial [Gaiella sp.]
MTGAAIARRRGGRLLAALDTALDRPRRTLGVLMAAQIVATVAFGLLVATHNGWVWFQGGDQIWFTSDAWAIGHGTLPPGDIAPGWAIVLIPFAWLAGATFVQQLPFIVVLNVLVLGPLALWCVWEIASRIAGRALALWCCVLWIVAPTVAIPLFADRYHERWIDQFVPQGLGLTAMADFPSMVAGLVIAALVVRAIDGRSWTDATLAGAVLSLAILMKPPNGLLAFGALLALLVARRWLEAASFSLAGIVGVAALAIFKVRTQGELPLLGLDEARLAAGHLGAIDVQRWLDADWRRYVELDLDHWRTQMAQLREYFWSARLFQWAPLAGVIAVARFRPAIAVLLAGWLGSFVLVKGTSTEASIEANTFWRLLMPAWPAYLLLLGAIVVLVPTLWRSLGATATARPEPARRLPGRALGAGLVACVVVPLAL